MLGVDSDWRGSARGVITGRDCLWIASSASPAWGWGWERAEMMLVSAEDGNQVTSETLISFHVLLCNFCSADIFSLLI